jgi:hypothetical protein
MSGVGKRRPIRPGRDSEASSRATSRLLCAPEQGRCESRTEGELTLRKPGDHLTQAGNVVFPDLFASQALGTGAGVGDLGADAAGL